MMDRLLTAGLCGNTIEQDIQTRGDSRVKWISGAKPKDPRSAITSYR